MDIAQKKRQDNIAEYILYIWQLEDLLRALQLSPEAVYTRLVAPRGLDTPSSQTILAWYMDIAGLMVKEGKERNGHLDHTLHLIADLQNFHEQLLLLPVGQRYRKLFETAAPELAPLRDKLGKEDVSDMELCFRALYATVLDRIRSGGEGSKASEEVINVISPMIAELVSIFHKAENGEIDLYADDKTN